MSESNSNKQYKRVPFDIELAKKIQSGEVEGKIINVTTEEISYTKYGSTLIDTHKDTFIELPEETSKYEFKPFDKVLVRNEDSDIWIPAFYQYYRVTPIDSAHHYANNIIYEQCIPYEGNEYLVGTSNNPE